MKANAGNPERDRKNDCLAESRMTGGRSKLFDLRDTCRQTGQESGKSPKNEADRNEKRQRVTTGTERIPRVETQAAGCSGTYRRIQFEERESRGVAKHALYRETPRSGRRTNDYFLLVRRSLRGWFPVRDNLLAICEPEAKQELRGSPRQRNGWGRTQANV